MNKRLLVVWLLVGVLLVAGVVYWGSQNIILCWDGVEIDEEMLMDRCGMTQADFFDADWDLTDCPEGEEAIRYVGSCDPEWGSIGLLAGGFGLGYLIFSGVAFGIWRLVRKK